MQQPDLFGDLPDLPGAAAASLADQPERWPARLAEITDWLAEETARACPDLAPAAVRGLAVRLTTRLAVEVGGQQWYWPQAAAIERILRDQEVWAAHDGTVDGPNGIVALARRYKVSANHIWEVLRRERALHRARVQPELPGIEPAPRRR